MPLIVQPDPDCVGNIYAHLFENSQVGVPRNLYWSVTVPLLPVEWEEDEYECLLTCEWITWPIKEWTQLNGASLATSTNASLIESSLYFVEHHPVHIDRLELRKAAGGARFSVVVAGEFDLEGFGELDGKNIRFAVQREVDFEGIVVVPGNLSPKPQSASDVLQVLSPYVELGAFGQPVLDRFRYVLPPSVSEA